jgi:hypothetical protein
MLDLLFISAEGLSTVVDGSSMGSMPKISSSNMYPDALLSSCSLSFYLPKSFLLVIFFFFFFNLAGTLISSSYANRFCAIVILNSSSFLLCSSSSTFPTSSHLRSLILSKDSFLLSASSLLTRTWWL